MKKLVLILIFITSAGMLRSGDLPLIWNSGIKFQVSSAQLIGRELIVKIMLTDTSGHSEIEFGGDRFRIFASNGTELKVSYFSLDGKKENSTGIIKTKLVKGASTPLVVTFHLDGDPVKQINEMRINYMNYYHYRPYNLTFGGFEVQDEISKSPMDEFAVSDGITMKLDKIISNGTKLKMIYKVRSEKGNKNFNFIIRSAVITDDQGNFYTCGSAIFNEKKFEMRDDINETFSSDKESTLELNYDTVEYKIKSISSLILSINNNLFTFKNINVGS